MNNKLPLIDVSAAILAGGESRRLRRDKIYLEYQGRRLLDHAINLAGKISPQITIIGKEPINDLPEGVIQARDIFSGKGPLAGIHTALSQSKTKYVAIMPVDMPFLAPDVYLRLWRDIHPQRPVVAKSSKGLEPLVSIWPVQTAKNVERQLRSDRLGVHLFLQEINAKIIDFAEKDSRFFININTPDDLRNLL